MDTNFILQCLIKAQSSLPLGLFNGRLGMCLYLFYAGEETHANEWLKNIIKELPNLHGTIQVDKGLCGAGWLMSLLIEKGWLCGDINEAVREIDDCMFRQLAYEKYSQNYGLQDRIHLLYYLNKRLKAQEKGSEAEYLYRQLAIRTLDDLFCQITEPQAMNEPANYTLNYELPQILFLFSTLLTSQWAKMRILKQTTILESSVLSSFPLSQGNRLYLLCALEEILRHKEMQRKEWAEYNSMLAQYTDPHYILNHEMGNKSIYLQDGMPSIYFLLTRRKEYRPQLAEYRERIMKAINNSPEWKLLSDNKAYLYSHLGLYQGISGTALAYNWMEQDKRKGELL